MIQKKSKNLFAVVLLLSTVFSSVGTVYAAGPTLELNSSNGCGPCRLLYKALGIADARGFLDYNLAKAKFGDAVRINQNPQGPSFPNVRKLDASGNPVGGFLDAETELKALAAQQKEASGDECIPARPGQVDETFLKAPEKKNVVYHGPASGYGPMTDNPGFFSPGYPQRDVYPDVIESDLNYRLRVSGSSTLEDHIKKALEVDPVAPEGKSIIRRVILPNAAQAEQFLASGGKTYEINGVKVQAGGKYTVGKTGTDGVTFDENCDPKQGPIPSTNPLGDFGGGEDVGFDGGGGGGGGGGPDGGGGGGLGGLASLLPALMQLMQGKQGQNGQQGQQAQNPVYDPAQAQSQCSKQGVSPVCGTDRKSYTNSCYAEQLGVPVASTGACPAAPVTPDVNAITTQLSQSGVPASLISTIRDAIVSALTSALGGGTNVPETTIR